MTKLHFIPGISQLCLGMVRFVINFSKLCLFQLTARGVTGPGIAVPNPAEMGLRMGPEPFLSLQSMEGKNAQNQQLTQGAVILMRVPKRQEKVSFLLLFKGERVADLLFQVWTCYF